MDMQITKAQIDEYKQKLIDNQGWICPVIQMYVEPDHVDVLFLNDHDWAISKEGMNALRAKWGDTYINDKIQFIPQKATEDEVVRD